jgi:hypothetical protein
MEWLNKKEMGLPIWAWGIIAAIVVFLAYRMFSGRSKSSGGSPAVATGADTQDQTDPGYTGDTGTPNDGGGSTAPPETQPPNIEPYPGPVETPPPSDGSGSLPHDTKQKTAVRAKGNTASLRNVLRRAVTKQAVPAPNSKKRIVKAAPAKPNYEKHPVAAAPVAVPQKTTRVATTEPVATKKPEPPKKRVY